jgi:hypothetical protein
VAPYRQKYCSVVCARKALLSQKKNWWSKRKERYDSVGITQINLSQGISRIEAGGANWSTPGTCLDETQNLGAENRPRASIVL